MSFAIDGVDWTKSGYFASAISQADLAQVKTKAQKPWLIWQEVLADARGGRFSKVPGLIDTYEGGFDWVLSDACAQLLGDAGGRACLTRMAEQLRADIDPIVSLMMKVEFSVAFATSGWLPLVASVVEAFTRAHTFEDAEILPIAISEWLEPAPGPLGRPHKFPSINAYGEAVLDKAAQLQAQLGSDAFVFRGARYSVRRVADETLAALAKPHFNFTLRQQFEAATGIDTRAFYKDGRLQPLAAAAIVEDFLASPDADRYEDGVRYFFGHRLD